MADTQIFQAPVYSAQGKQGGTRQLPDSTFDGTVNVPVMHQAVKAFLANRRQGTASTKTRGKVVGGNQKPWKQKGTGRARQGSIRAPTGRAVVRCSVRFRAATTRRCRAR